MSYASNWKQLLGAAALAATLLAGAAWAQKDAPVPKPTPVAGAPAASLAATPLEKFKAAGKGAPLAVLPTVLGGRPFPQVGGIVALFLERAGMTGLEISAAAFVPPENADLAQTAAAFAEHVKADPPATEYALFTEFRVAPKRGFTELRSVVVNKAGEVVWQDRQAKGDADWDRLSPKEPMECCLLVAQRLRPVLGLDDPQSDSGKPGKIAEQLRTASGVPDDAEMDAIHARGAAFKKAAAGATLLVYPPRAGDAYSPQSATALAALLGEKQLTRATAAPEGPRPQIAPDPNQQKVLWSMARALSQYVKQNPPGADYVLFADYIMGKDVVGGVNFAICNKQGELVVVDFQNSHWPDFQSIDPKKREDCDRLVAKRMEGYCR
jgi:hypothetical protein